MITHAVEHEVIADDGVPLHVEINGDPDAPVTLVMCHGYGLNRASWSFQRGALGAFARIVCWDQRGHGRSGYGARDGASIDQLGRDLHAVLDQTVPVGPVVLVGHSMGGMTIMALAAEHPELFGDRVLGVALVATSASSVVPHLGVLLNAVVHRVAGQAVRLLLPLIQLTHRLPCHRPAVRALARRFAFASEVSESAVDLLVDMVASTSPKAMAEVLPQFHSHDKRVALTALRHVTTLVLVGEKDFITPPGHSHAIAAELPEADLVVVPEAGHAVMLERPEVVTGWLLDLLDLVAPHRTA